jgi:hypothetical protein
MQEPVDEIRTEPYGDAIRRRVCPVCLDERVDGECARRCLIMRHLPAVVDAIRAVDSPRMDEYIAAVESAVCRSCGQQAPDGTCVTRDRAECTLATYLFLVVDAVEEVKDARAATRTPGTLVVPFPG